MSTPPPTTDHAHVGGPVHDITAGDTRLPSATCAAGESERADGIADARMITAADGDEAPDTDTDAEAGEPVVFYATNTPNNPIAAAGAQARKNSWFFYQSLLPDLGDDVDLTLTSLAKDLGLSYSILSGIIRAHFRMQGARTPESGHGDLIKMR